MGPKGSLKKVFKHIKLNKNEISIFLFYLVYQRAKAVLREKFIALNAYISKD